MPVAAAATKEPNFTSVPEMPKRSSSDLDSGAPEKEASFSDPTQLCRLIMSRKYKEASKRIWSHREEAATWICIQNAQSRHQNLRQNIVNLNNKYTFRKLPIHIACGMLSNSPKLTKEDKHLESLIIQFIVLHPLCCCKPDHEGLLPIHEAIRRHASVRVIAMLLTANPASILVRDIHGRTPTHINRSRSDGRINYVENALQKGVRFWEKAREQVKNPHAEDEMRMVKKASPKSPVRRDDSIVLHHQDGFNGFTKKPQGREVGFVKQDGFTRTLKRISSATTVVALEADLAEQQQQQEEEHAKEEGVFTPEESADLAVAAIEDAVSDFFKKMSSISGNDDISSDDSDAGSDSNDDPAVAKLESRIRKLERMLNESYEENNELVEALKEVNESYGKGSDERDVDKNEIPTKDAKSPEEVLPNPVDTSAFDSIREEYSFDSDEDIVHPSVASENNYLKRKIKAKEDEVQYLHKELSRLRKSNAAYRNEVDRLLSENNAGGSTTLDLTEEARRKFKSARNGLHPNMFSIGELDEEDLGGPITRKDGLKNEAKTSSKISARALHLKLRLRFKDSINLSEIDAKTGKNDSEADFNAILQALESTSNFATERFLARKVQELEGKLNDAIEARKQDAEMYLREMDTALIEMDMLKAQIEGEDYEG